MSTAGGGILSGTPSPPRSPPCSRAALGKHLLLSSPPLSLLLSFLLLQPGLHLIDTVANVPGLSRLCPSIALSRFPALVAPAQGSGSLGQRKKTPTEATNTAALPSPPNPMFSLLAGDQILVHKQTKLKSQDSPPRMTGPKGVGLEGGDVYYEFRATGWRTVTV